MKYIQESMATMRCMRSTPMMCSGRGMQSFQRGSAPFWTWYSEWGQRSGDQALTCCVCLHSHRFRPVFPPDNKPTLNQYHNIVQRTLQDHVMKQATPKYAYQNFLDLQLCSNYRIQHLRNSHINVKLTNIALWSVQNKLFAVERKT